MAYYPQREVIPLKGVLMVNSVTEGNVRIFVMDTFSELIISLDIWSSSLFFAQNIFP